MTREEVYKLIDGERNYQDKLAGARNGKEEDRLTAKSTGDYIVLLSSYIRRAQDEWTDNAGDRAALDVVRKIAGIAVHCMEDNGAPSREEIDEVLEELELEEQLKRELED